MSQQGIPLLCLPGVATGVITQYRAVTFADAQVAAANAAIKGVARRGAALGAEFEMVTKGTAVCEAGGPVSVGAAVVTDNQGRVTAGAGPVVIGYALQEATVAGNLIEVLLV